MLITETDVDRVVKLLMEAHVDASPEGSFVSRELKAPPELRTTIRLAMAEIGARRERPEIARSAKRAKQHRIALHARELAKALRDSDMTEDLHGPQGFLAVRAGLCIEDIEQMALRADAKADRIPEGRGGTTLADVEGRASAQWVCVAFAVWLVERAIGRVPGATNSTLLKVLDQLWLGVGAEAPSTSFWERPVAAVLNPNSQAGDGKVAVLLNARGAVKHVARLGGLLRLIEAPTRLEKISLFLSLPEPPPDGAGSQPSTDTDEEGAHARDIQWD